MQATHSQKRFGRDLKVKHPIAFAHAAGSKSDPQQWSKDEASRIIGKISDFVAYNPGSQRAKIAEILRSEDMSISRTVAKLRPMVGERPLVWSKNENGQRVALPKSQQLERMPNTVRSVWEELQNKPIPDYKPGENGTPTPENGNAEGDPSEPDWVKEMREAMGEGDGQGEGESESEGESEDESEGEGEAEMTPEERMEKDAKNFLAFVRKARKYWSKRNADGITAESIGMRPALNGAKMIANGITDAACRVAMSIHWTQDARDDLNVPEFDPTTYKQDQVPTLSEKIGESVHKVLPYCVDIARAKVPLCLIGTHGTGKTEIARQLAAALDLKFGFASMTEGTPPSTFYGRVFPEHVQSVFEDCYANGGVFLFDEMDAAHPNLLLIVNAALANGHFSNTATGEIIDVHPDFVPVCAMNTTGLGADRNYTGRKRLDAAALDRWHMGRVRVPIDEQLETQLFSMLLKAGNVPEDHPEADVTPEVDEQAAADKAAVEAEFAQ